MLASAFVGSTVGASWLWAVVVTCWVVGGYMLASTDHTEGFGEGVTGSLVERMGLFTIIVLGELVVGVVGGISDAEHRDVTTVATGILGLTVAMGIWWNYFDMLGRRVPGQRGHRLASWLYAHLPLAMAIAASGAAMVSIIEHAHDSRTPGPTAWLLTGSVAVTLGAVSIACTALPVDEFPSGMQRWIGPTLGIAAAVTIAIGAFRPAPIVLLSCVSAVLLLAWLALFAVYLALGGDPDVDELPTRPRPRCAALSRPLLCPGRVQDAPWVAGITAGGDDRKIEVARPHLVEGVLGELVGNAESLVGWVDGDHVDLARALDLVENDVDEATDRTVARADPRGVAVERLADRRSLRGSRQSATRWTLTPYRSWPSPT